MSALLDGCTDHARLCAVIRNVQERLKDHAASFNGFEATAALSAPLSPCVLRSRRTEPPHLVHHILACSSEGHCAGLDSASPLQPASAEGPRPPCLPKGPKYLYRVSILGGITIKIWESIPHNRT